MEFEHRGIVEGFYGPAWSHADRLELLKRLGQWGMNRYLYAPKDDPLHREQWREHYPPPAMREFSELIERGADADVAVGFALSPGLSIRYSSSRDVADLCAKLVAFAERGARFFGLTLDDIPSELTDAADRSAFASLAAAHVALAHALRAALPADSLIWLVPTDYAGTAGSDYLSELSEDLDASIEVGWTGRSVLPGAIRAGEAEERSRALGRRLLIWDNTPVADGSMRNVLHLGPYAGRDPELSRHCSGVLLNPMQHARASTVTLRTAADFLRDPERYEPEASWTSAVRESGEGAEDAFALFAAAHRFSFVTPGDRDGALEAAIDAVREAMVGEVEPEIASEALSTLRGLVEARASAAPSLRSDLRDRALAVEIEPWLASHQRECERMRVALDCLDVLCSARSQNAMGLAFAGMEGRLTKLPALPHVSFGPRRAFYPVFESLEEDATRFSSEPGLFLDRCLADELIRLAEQAAGPLLGLVEFQ